MGYPTDLEDYKSSELLIELNRNNNQCPHCRQWTRDCTCQFKNKRDQYHDVNFHTPIVQDLM